MRSTFISTFLLTTLSKLCDKLNPGLVVDVKVNRGTIKARDTWSRSNYVKAMCNVWVRTYYPHIYTKFMAIAEEKYPKLQVQERKRHVTEVSAIVDKVGKGE